MITIDADALRERIRERLEEPDDDSHCPNCHVMLTETDRDDGACTNCGAGPDVGDESVDEGLWED